MVLQLDEELGVAAEVIATGREEFASNRIVEIGEQTSASRDGGGVLHFDLATTSDNANVTGDRGANISTLL